MLPLAAIVDKLIMLTTATFLPTPPGLYHAIVDLAAAPDNVIIPL